MATQHKVKTNEMQKQIGINIEEDDKNGDEEINHKNIDIEFEQDPMTLSILNKVS